MTLLRGENNMEYKNKKFSYFQWVKNKILMDMTFEEYCRSLITPFNIIAGIIVLIGLYFIILRFTIGLSTVTHASHDVPWGLFLGWGLFGGVPLSATGFVISTAYYIFGYKGLQSQVRLSYLTGFLGYLFAVIFLLVDLGRPWRIYYPMILGFGTASVLFLIAWHVALYLSVQFLEFSTTLTEWLQMKRVRHWAMVMTIGLTIAGIILSTLHQSALGAMYLLAPGKLHPLWYTPYIWILYLCSSIYAALCMMIFVSMLVCRFMKHVTDNFFLKNVPWQTIGYAKAASITMYVYFVLKVITVAHSNNWHLLNTGYGYWYLLEIFGFVLLPAIILSFAVKTKNLFIARFGAIYGLVGIILNRLNVSIFALNWKMPDHLEHIIPPMPEVAVVLGISTFHILLFRWILNRMPVTRTLPEYSGEKVH